MSYNVAHPTTREEAFGTVIVAFTRLSDEYLIELARLMYARAYPLEALKPPLRIVREAEGDRVPDDRPLPKRRPVGKGGAA